MQIVCSIDDRERWLLERQRGIGSSEAAAVIGLSRRRSPMSLYAEKLGIQVGEPPDSERIEWGTILEPIVREEFARRTGRRVLANRWLYRSDELPWALATFDAFILDGPRSKPLEIKTAGAEKADEWTDGPPEEYRCQLQWQLLVSKEEVATIACLLGGQRLIWVDVPRDERMIRALTSAGAELWDHVERVVPPDPDSSKWTRVALAALYPKDTGEILQLPGELMVAADVLETAKDEESRAEEKRRGAENRIKAAMGSATRGVLPDGRMFQWTTQERRGYEVKPSVARVFRAVKGRNG